MRISSSRSIGRALAAGAAADLPRAQAQFEAHARMPTSATAFTAFTAQIPDPAWKNKPVWYMVAKADKIINPDLERIDAARAAAQTVEIDGTTRAGPSSRFTRKHRR